VQAEIYQLLVLAIYAVRNCLSRAMAECCYLLIIISKVRGIMMRLKRGKAADIDGLSNEHLSSCHPVLSVILSRLFNLILSSRYTPLGFKRSYIVPMPKPKDTRTKGYDLVK